MQEFEFIQEEMIQGGSISLCTALLPSEMSIGTKNVGINGIKFKCCPIGI